MDETPSDPATAVDERMDRLELGMGDRCLGNRRDVVPAEEIHEIPEQARNLVRRGGTSAEIEALKGVYRRKPSMSRAI